MLRRITLAATVALFALGSAAQAQTVLKLAHPFPETDTMHQLATDFAKAVEEKTSGALTVQIFPAGQLGNDQQMIDGVRTGVIDAALLGLNNYTGLVPKAGAIELPFIFPTRQDAFGALDGAAGDAIDAAMRPVGLKLLGFGDSGYRQVTNNRGPVRTPEDMKGLRMRVNSSKVLNDMFNALGANPQQIPVAELYSALETGVVDAQEQPLPVVLSFHFDDHQKYLSITNHAYGVQGFTMNVAKFDGLTAEQQTAILAAADTAIAAQRERAEAAEADIISQLEANGMEVNRDVDTAAFQEAVKSVWDNYVTANSDEMIKLIQGQ